MTDVGSTKHHFPPPPPLSGFRASVFRPHSIQRDLRIGSKETHIVLDQKISHGHTTRDSGDALCQRRNALVDRATREALAEYTVVGSRGTCRRCLRRAHDLWSFGPMFSVIGIFYDAKHGVLSIGRRHDHTDLGFPGGKLKEGERPRDGLVREVMEETGVEVVEAHPLFDAPAEINEGWSLDDAFVNRGARMTRAYRVTAWIGTPVALEGLPVAWVSSDRMLDPHNSYHGFNKLAFKASAIPFTRLP